MRKKTIIVYRGEACPVPNNECEECSYLWEGKCCLVREEDEMAKKKPKGD